MIRLEELYRPEDVDSIKGDVLAHLTALHYRLNFIRYASKIVMPINRGFSTPEQQVEIYEKMGKAPKMGSQHLIGAAADVEDLHGDLRAWVQSNLDIVKTQGLFCEAFTSTPTWVHFQLYPFSSWSGLADNIVFEP